MSILLSALLSLGGFAHVEAAPTATVRASAPRALQAEASAAAPARAAALTRALAAITPLRIGADLEFIASDELAGRDTPSPGLRTAARYLRARLTALGWQPGGPEGSWFHHYELETTRIDEQRLALSSSATSGEQQPLSYAFGRDYFYFAPQDARELELRAPVVYCGDLRRDELAALPVKGAYALCIDDGSSHFQRRRTLGNAGALGVVVMPGAEYAGKAYAEKFADGLKRMRLGSLRYPGEREPSGLPSVFLTREAGLALLAQARGARAADWQPKPGETLELELHDQRGLHGAGRIQLENVVGYWPGSDPELAREVIVVSAHYDHVGTQDGEIHNGADDNGTGTCGLLALADALVEYGPLRRSVMLIWVSGEEKGLYGSRAFAQQPFFPDGGRALANINLDMIGRNDPAGIFVTPSAQHPARNGLTRELEHALRAEGFSSIGDADEYWERSDHKSFATLGIPVCFAFAGVHEDYHKPGDDAEKIDRDKVARVVRSVLRTIDALQADELDID